MNNRNVMENFSKKAAQRPGGTRDRDHEKTLL